MTRFSSRYSTFEDWLDTKKTLSKYVRRIVSYITRNPEASLREARGHKEEPPPTIIKKVVKVPEIPEAIYFDNYRYTIGTNISDRHVPVSFTGFYYKIGEEFSYSEEKTCYRKYDISVARALKRLYPFKNYDLNDVTGPWGGIVREAHNEIVLEEIDDGSFTFEMKKKGIPRYSEVGVWK